MKSRLIFLISAVLLSLLYAGGCRRAGVWLAKEDVPPHADALVVLMGAFPERALQAFDMWEEGFADTILIVEEYMGELEKLKERGVSVVSNSEQAASSLVALGVPAPAIAILPGDARSILDEAVAVKKYLDSGFDADTLILVSSPPHMRRAAIIFRETLRYPDRSVAVGCKPSNYSSYNGAQWWRRKEDIQSVVSEFIKICNFEIIEKHKKSGPAETPGRQP